MSNIQRRLFFGSIAFCLVAIAAPNTASATVTLSKTLSQTVGGGSPSLAGQFDLSPYFSKGFAVSAATLSVFGTSDETVTSAYQTSSAIMTNFTSNRYIINGTKFTVITDHYYVKYVNWVDDDEQKDSIFVASGGDSAPGYDTYQDEPGPYLETGFATIGGTYSTGYLYLTTQTRIHNIGYYKDVSASFSLKDAGLAAATTTKEIPYQISGLTGLTRLLSVSATFDLVAVATPAPEPATWLSAIAGFGVIGVSMRRRRRPLVELA